MLYSVDFAIWFWMNMMKRIIYDITKYISKYFVWDRFQSFQFYLSSKVPVSWP